MITFRQVAWEWLDRPGLEVGNVRQRLEDIVIDGHVVAAWDQSVLRLRYRLRCDTHWRVEEARIDLESSAGYRRAVLEHDGDSWRVDSIANPGLEGCQDIDIIATPFTNTLPIRRLSWQVEQSRDLRMVYVNLPSLEVKAMPQRYTRLADNASNQRRFRYHAIESGFTAELTVDDDGLVLDYPPYWRQIHHDAQDGG